MSDQPAPGWYPDPGGEPALRYWDGEQWTSHLHADDLDAVTGFASSPPGASGRGRQETSVRFDRAVLAAEVSRPRPLPSTADALSAAGGALGALGVVMLAVGALFSDSLDGRGEVGIIGVLLLAGAYAMVIAGSRWLRPAALAGAIVGPFMIIAAIFAESVDGRVEVVLFGALLAAVWLAMFMGPGFTGAPILMAAALTGAWLALVALLTDPFTPDPYYADPWATTGPVNDPASVINAAGIVTLICAIGAVVAAGVFDSKGMHVLATPFLAVAVLQSIVGLASATTDASGEAASLLTVVVGVVFLAVGALGQRRGSMWFGAFLIASGSVGFIGNAVTDTVAAGVLLLLVAAGLVLVGSAVQQRLSPRSADEPTPI